MLPVPDEFIREINAQKVSGSLLGEVMILWASLPPDEWQDFDRRLARVVDFVAEKRVGDPMLAMAVALRLMALDAIVIDPEIRGWLMSGKSPDGITYLHGDLVRVAAEQEVLEGPAGEPTFDREAFRVRLMGMAKARGSA